MKIDKIKTDAEKLALQMWPDKENKECIRLREYVKATYIAGATEWADKAQEPLINLLDEARLQIEYLHIKFGETGSGNNILSRIETELAKYKEVGNG